MKFYNKKLNVYLIANHKETIELLLQNPDIEVVKEKPKAKK